jgi:hypothetical protein
MDIPATARALAWMPDEARRSEAIESALRAAHAAALREAAEDMKTLKRAGFGGLGRIAIQNWLRDRASRLAKQGAL